MRLVSGLTTASTTRHRLKALVLDNPARISAADWASLRTGGNPFMRRDFHLALYETGCTGVHSGWDPAFIAMRHDDSTLAALATGYLKHHSYGEYVFDWAWANAYQRAGLRYYPKLVVAAPFSPVTGPRLLVHHDHDPAEAANRLGAAAIELALDQGLSSVHWLFPPEAETRRLENSGWLTRKGYQFHWHNAGYDDFGAFLAALSSKKRKNVKRERRQVAEAGIRTEMIPGNEVTDATWARFFHFYLSTTFKRGGSPYLNEDFFRTLGERMGDQVRLLLARRDTGIVAAALYLQDDDCLYGRYWGCEREFDSLHFECCYYAPIEYCITHRLSRFEAGAQGEHKLSRGLVPATTWSAHWLAQPQFADAVARFLDEETDQVSRYMEVLDTHAPYRRETP